ncbi:GH3 auxin-responsive promoter family protein [Cyclobacterium plantarum]|uniref:GH3 auxin-responsive promoter family protein n=1 Tax=Cyclobacterium plantarum TaxID=2716263 RepID=A0ABX0H0L0_9BACT|nr:GH3 auxin-responsive promoter family protein [Cyclobacterium plantarum]NHE55296.1 GH3 auxin-responsive promoter family protein [Cyclobacterium plantarum]
MEVINTFMTWIFKNRIGQIEKFKNNPLEIQREILFKLIHTAKDTEFGKKHHFRQISSYKDFNQWIPVHDYEAIMPYIQQTMKGRQNVIWPTPINWFSKSSGTTGSRSKFIPVSPESLEDCHFKGGKDMLSLYVNNYPETKLFTGKSLSIGGSLQTNPLDVNKNSSSGDISAVIMRNLPKWAQLARTPSLEVALMSEWEEKIAKMAQETIKENVTSLTGVPTWTLVLIKKVLEITHSDNILEIWPNLEVFFHGAVAFGPYRNLFQNLIPSKNMHYMETYNASEGFFGIQDQKNSEELLLMLDYGIFYEFIPMEDFQNNDPEIIPLDQVETGKNYAILITTNAGLWRYKIGDTVKFTSTRPYRFKISGRTKHFINAFGEELIVENAEKAIENTCKRTGTSISNFTAAPVYFGENQEQGTHEWIIEFVELPKDNAFFTSVLDEELRMENSDYDAKRYRDMVLKIPIVHFAAQGLFEKWLKSKGKLGGQNKVPRLSNDREYLEEILKLL